jgi:hypothetical protein
MTIKSLPLRALWSALGATAYIALVATIFACHVFPGPDRAIFTPIAGLLLLVFSVLVMGTLLLVPPLRLYLDGKKAEGVRLLLLTVMWMGVFMILAMIVLAVV